MATSSRWIATAGRLLDSRWLTALALCAVAVCVAEAVARAPIDAPRDLWADVRTSRAVAAARGFDLYTGRGGEPLTGHIYGPVAFWLYAGAALGGTPSQAVRIATFSAAVLLLAPAALLLGVSGEGRPDRELAIRAWAVSALYLHFAIEPLAAWHPHVDAPAAGLAALACWAALRLARAPSSWGWAWTLAVFAAAAVWAKQTMAPILAAGPIFLWLVAERRAAVRAAAATLAAAAALGVLAGLCYGMDDVLYTIFGVPSAQEMSLRAALQEWGRFGDLLPLVALASIGSALRLGTGESAPPRAALFAFAVGLALLGPAVLGRIKISGSSNNFYAPLYFLALAAAALAVSASRRDGPRSESSRWARQALGVLLLVYCAQAGLHAAESLQLRKAVPVSDVAYRAARARPGELYFPERPLVNLLAEGRMDNSWWGLTTRSHAGEPIDVERLVRSLPPSVRLIAVEPSGSPGLRERLSILPRIELAELPGWPVFELDRSAFSATPTPAGAP